MSQEEVYKLLEKNKDKWLSTEEIKRILKNNRSSINNNLRKLFLNNEIKRIQKEMRTKQNRYSYFLYKIKNQNDI